MYRFTVNKSPPKSTANTTETATVVSNVLQNADINPYGGYTALCPQRSL